MVYLGGSYATRVEQWQCVGPVYVIRRIDRNDGSGRSATIRAALCTFKYKECSTKLLRVAVHYHLSSFFNRSFARCSHSVCLGILSTCARWTTLLEIRPFSTVMCYR